MKTRWFPISITLSLCSTLLFTACGKDGGSDYNSGGGNNNPPPAANTIGMSNMRFSVSSLNVKAGTTVTWTNDDNTSHTVTADDNSFSSGNLKAGETYKHTFSDVGTYPYHCNLHTSMKASIVVDY
jgi:plastocyanin